MSDLKKMAQQAAKQQAAHLLGFGLNSVKGLFFAWLAAECALMAFWIGAFIVGMIGILWQTGWIVIPIGIVIINLLRFAAAYGDAKEKRLRAEGKL